MKKRVSLLLTPALVFGALAALAEIADGTYSASGAGKDAKCLTPLGAAFSGGRISAQPVLNTRKNIVFTKEN